MADGFGQPASETQLQKDAPSVTKDSAIDFFNVVERLKLTKRTGWVNSDVKNPESIADHMYRMAIMVCVPVTSVDRVVPGSGVGFGRPSWLAPATDRSTPVAACKCHTAFGIHVALGALTSLSHRLPSPTTLRRRSQVTSRPTMASVRCPRSLLVHLGASACTFAFHRTVWRLECTRCSARVRPAPPTREVRQQL